jgi:N-formylglutamate deformylase
MEKFRLVRRDGPLLVSMPHTGTHLPPELRGRMTSAARAVPDTDWHLERLYDFLHVLEATALIATHSRYAVDLNRPPDDENLYPGRDTTALVPVDSFHKEPLYLPGETPGEDEKRARVETYWKPYHAALESELARIRARRGYALLWDAHSIFSVLPRFFEGRLTDLNLGSADGRSCGAGLGERLLVAARAAGGYTAVLDGRFKGGYITRRYGDPAARVHAVQLELSEANYMDEHPPYAFREDLARRLRPRLKSLLETMLAWGAGAA